MSYSYSNSNNLIKTPKFNWINKNHNVNTKYINQIKSRIGEKKMRMFPLPNSKLQERKRIISSRKQKKYPRKQPNSNYFNTSLVKSKNFKSYKRGTTRSGKNFRGKPVYRNYNPNNIAKIMNALSNGVKYK